MASLLHRFKRPFAVTPDNSNRSDLFPPAAIFTGFRRFPRIAGRPFH
jgi:hypothetical protein